MEVTEAPAPGMWGCSARRADDLTRDKWAVDTCARMHARQEDTQHVFRGDYLVVAVGC